MLTEKIYIGCCGAYCKTCKPFLEGFCKGCKLDFDTGQRDINKVRCKIKICCFKNKSLETCADCGDEKNCKIVNDFYNKKGYKYKKYKQAVKFIKEKGYKKFIRQANKWKNAYGKLE